uniref:Biotin carboxyl carrier protein of acetyl-CoA carboxylase n=1 Tax=Geranium incanum TaxID=1158081 RepID=A0A286SC19_9ROSI|nr:biotin carboxyl carrier protein subunit [Geranium incanum]
MASSLATTASASASSLSKSVSSSLPHCTTERSFSKVSFRLSPKPRLRFSAKGLQPSRNHSTVVRAQVNEVRLENLISNFNSFLDMLFGSSVAFKVAVDGSSNDTATHNKSEVEAKDDQSSEALATEESISEFIAQVANLVKLVDSRDIAELELKQQGCELLIRKKEALPQPPAPAPASFVMHHSPPLSASAPPAPPPAAAPSPSPTPAPASLPAPSAKSSHPPMLCAMPGTFYRSPAPGAPPFVNVGDKVQKGQVICIIEAMKLMNEIEADKAGTIVEILLADGKPVSIGTPIFVIAP